MDSSNYKIDKLSFVHIPKTAGSSLNAELEKYFGEKNSIRIGDQDMRYVFSSMGPEKLKNYSYITGHISIEELIKKGINYPAISIMREPVKRLISLQHYISESDLKDHLEVDFKDIDQLLLNMWIEKKLNMQCWHLSGQHDFERAVESIRENSIFVVPLEYYQDLIETLSDLLSTPLSNISINVTKYKTAVDAVDLKHDLLESIIGDDKRLFSYVKQNYESLKQEFIQSLAR